MIMLHIKTDAIVLSRINYQETDRILNVLTPNNGKVSLIAKGSRLMKSKLSGGIELFTINKIVYLKGRSEMGTIISARLDKNFPNIITSLDLVSTGYEFLRIIDRLTESNAEDSYYNLLDNALIALNDIKLNHNLIKFWFNCRLLSIYGHKPNLDTDKLGKKLQVDYQYDFDEYSMSFNKNSSGTYSANHIKFLRLVFMVKQPVVLANVSNYMELINDLKSIITAATNFYLGINDYQ